MKLHDRVIVVTGAIGGIGRGIAHALLDDGARVVLTDLDESRLETVSVALDADRTRTLGVAANVHSAGLRASGRRADPSSVAVLRSRGVNLRRHRTTLLTAELLRGADLVLGMGGEHVGAAVSMDPEVWPYAYSLKELLRRGEIIGVRAGQEPFDQWVSRVHASRNLERFNPFAWIETVADPRGRSRAAFEAMALELDTLLDRLVTMVWASESVIASPDNVRHLAIGQPPAPALDDLRLRRARRFGT